MRHKAPPVFSTKLPPPPRNWWDFPVLAWATCSAWVAPLRQTSWRRTILAWSAAAVLVLLVFQSDVSPIVPDPGGTPLLLADPRPEETDWPEFRGRGRQGHIVQKQMVTAETGPAPAAVWQTSLGLSVGSPCLWGERVFLLTLDVSTRSMRLVCIDRTTGNRQWVSELPGDYSSTGDLEQAARNMNAWHFTPACDGDRVFVPTVVQGELCLTAVTCAGVREWTRPVGPCENRPGYGISPALHGPLVILSVDQRSSVLRPWQSRSYVCAVHRQTGELVWRTLRRNGEGRGIPVVAELSGQQQLVIPDEAAVRAYDPATGEPLWSCRWKAPGIVGSVVTDGIHVYACSSAPQGEILCVKGDGSGDVTSTHCVWRQRRPDTTWGWLTYAEPWLLHQREDGWLYALDDATGRTIWRTQLGETVECPPMIAGRQLYCLDGAGILHGFDIDQRGAALLEIPVTDMASATLIPTPAGWLLRTSREVSRMEPESELAAKPSTPTRTR